MVDAWTAFSQDWYHGLMNKHWVLLALATILLIGCNKPAEDQPASQTPPTPEGGSVVPQGTPNQPTGQATPGANNGGNVQVLTGGAGAGGVTPVVGGEDLQGGGSGVGQAAKDSARNAATKVQGGQQPAPEDDNQVADQ